MRSADVDAIAVGHFFVAWGEEEWYAAFVHGRPDGVGPQAQQQFEDSGVGFRPHLSVEFPVERAHGFRFRLEVLCRPGIQRPVLVVEEDAAELHGGRLPPLFHAGHGEAVQLVGAHVGPPFPRRHTDHARYLEQAIGQPAGVAPRHDDLAAVGLADLESLPLAFDGGGVHSFLGEERAEHRVAKRAGHDGRFAGGRVRPFQPGLEDVLHVLLQDAHGGLHDVFFRPADIDGGGFSFLKQVLRGERGARQGAEAQHREDSFLFHGVCQI